MISFDEAHDLMMKSAALLGTESVPLRDAANRVLARDALADVDMPPFDKAAMDGFACRRADLGNPLKVIETIPAGRMPTRALGPGECSRIMTGAPVPEAADCVVMQEYTEQIGTETIRFVGTSSADNICKRAEDTAKGDVVLRRGDRIGAAQIAVLASVGVHHPLVSRRARVAVMATGSELLPPDGMPSGAAIRDSNSSQLCAQIAQIGALADGVGIVTDAEEPLVEALRRAMPDHDLILLSGGVSTGAFDFVPAALRKCGFEFLFESVAMQPGRPMVFGRTPNGIFCCGLPGNPVSTYVVFELLLKPFLLRMMGHVHRPTVVRVRLDDAFSRSKADRQTTLPVRFSAADTVIPVPYHGSAHIHAMCLADALLVVPSGTRTIAKGEHVDVRLL